MKTGTNQLAYLILEYLANQDEPYLAFGKGGEKLTKVYREVVNTGVYSYQIHYYLNLVEQYIGVDKRWLVRASIHDILKKNDGGDIELGNALNLITSAVSIGGFAAELNEEGELAALEINIAISFLLGLPNSPHYAHSTALREQEILQMDHELEWKYVEYIKKGRIAVDRSFHSFLQHNRSSSNEPKFLML